MEKFFQKAYYDPASAAAYGGVKQLRDQAIKAGFKKVTFARVKAWLEQQETYSLFKRARKKFKRNQVPMVRIDYQWEADLADMNKYSDENDGYKYILVIIDTFSRYVWTRPLKSKSTKDTAEAFEDVFKEGRTPDILRSDAGKEFTGNALKKVLDEKNILHFVAQNETKASFSERQIQTLKMKLTKDIYERQNKEWISRLQDLTRGYNNSVHSSTGTAPSKINETNEDEVRFQQYLIKAKRNKTLKIRVKRDVKEKQLKKIILKARRKSKASLKFEPEDLVRVSYLKDLFSRAYDVNYSHELFRIVKAWRRDGLPVYSIKDYAGDPIKGVFYQQELTAAGEPRDGVFKIDKVLKSRTLNGKKQSLVKFLGWPSKFNEWLDSSTIKDVKRR